MSHPIINPSALERTFGIDVPFAGSAPGASTLRVFSARFVFHADFAAQRVLPQILRESFLEHWSPSGNHCLCFL